MLIFERASKSKLRFNSVRGLLTVEDLWDLPLSGNALTLDLIAKGINKQLKEAEEESFVKPYTEASTELSLALDIVKRVIEVKLINIETQNKRKATAEKRSKILEILASKKNEGLKEKSTDELMAMLED